MRSSRRGSGWMTASSRRRGRCASACSAWRIGAAMRAASSATTRLRCRRLEPQPARSAGPCLFSRRRRPRRHARPQRHPCLPLAADAGHARASQRRPVRAAFFTDGGGIRHLAGRISSMRRAAACRWRRIFSPHSPAASRRTGASGFCRARRVRDRAAAAGKPALGASQDHHHAAQCRDERAGHHCAAGWRGRSSLRGGRAARASGGPRQGLLSEPTSLIARH